MANSATATSVIYSAVIETLKLALETKAGIKQPENKKTALTEELLTQETMQANEGLYIINGGMPVRVSSASGYLQTEVKGRTLRLVPRADGLFFMQYRFLGLFPISLGEKTISASAVSG